MNPSKILSDLFQADIDVRLADDGVNVVVSAPAGKLTHDKRQLVLANKPALIEFLLAARRTTAELIESAMRACDHHGDGPEARSQMRADCQATPLHLISDLTEHFEKTYPRKTPT